MGQWTLQTLTLPWFFSATTSLIWILKVIWIVWRITVGYCLKRRSMIMGWLSGSCRSMIVNFIVGIMLQNYLLKVERVKWNEIALSTHVVQVLIMMIRVSIWSLQGVFWVWEGLKSGSRVKGWYHWFLTSVKMWHFDFSLWFLFERFSCVQQIWTLVNSLFLSTWLFL